MTTSTGDGGPPTLESVAALAGVSRATAGRVLAGSSHVSERAKESVLEAAASLSYVTNRAARSLVTRRSDSIAFVVSESEERFFQDPFFPAVLRGTHSEVSAHHQQLVFVVLSSPADREQFYRFAAGGHVDGAIFVSLHGADPLPTRLRQVGIPVVLMGRPYRRDDDAPFVDADNVGGARAAVRALVDAGCERIATITGPTDMPAAQDRLAGYEQELAAAGLRRAASRVVASDFTMDGGYAAMQRLLRGRGRPDGVFVANDLMAAGGLRALRQAGVAVPDDLRVVGFDDIPLAAVAHPALTTVRQPMQEMGREMARLLMAVIEGRPDVASTVLPTVLVPRASC